MVNSFDFLVPGNQSVYMEAAYPNTKQDVLQYMETYTPPKPGAPRLAPQPAKDSWYYKNDGIDDGKISFKEKVKAFVKGGTYNMVRGLFCDKDGFNFARTLGTIGIGTAIALTGPIGAIAAGALGLVVAGGKFANSVEQAKKAVTDQQAREAYEDAGEGTSIGALSLFGGFKGFNAIKNNFAFAKAHPNLKVGFFDRFLKWNAGKYATLKPTKDPTPKPAVDPNPNPKPVNDTPTPKPTADTTVTEEPTVTPKPPKKPRVRKPRTTKKPKIFVIPNLKGWNGNVKNIDTSIPKDVVYVPDSAPLNTHPNPVGIPNNEIWLP